MEGGYPDAVANVLSGGSGNDLLIGQSGADRLLGGDGNDSIYGGQGEDSIEGGAGRDAAYASDQDDDVRGGPGPDRVYGGFGGDRVVGDAGQDIIDGTQGTDALDGGSDADTCLNGELVLGCEHTTPPKPFERSGRAEATARPPRIDAAPTRGSATGALRTRALGIAVSTASPRVIPWTAIFTTRSLLTLTGRAPPGVFGSRFDTRADP